ncbi:MAG: hypothetical protein NC123_08490 [Butyrivibrio sp.]|nr:hypothetical protein [Butyrivibrio sp.]
MEKKKTIFDYLAQVLLIFGFAMLTLNIFCLVFGESARDLSAMFALGNKGVPTEIAFQYLCLSVLIVSAKYLFFTDALIKKMPVALRTVCMLAAVIIIIAAFVILFHWFPARMWQPWAMFFLCFGISFLGSWLVMTIKEKTENRRMEEALQKLKEHEEKAAKN